uniref:Uncharacterized protein n=1 Tax=Anguilla anguilla TaxID=7936 RepID=A0A0E9QX88_ANGAN
MRMCKCVYAYFFILFILLDPFTEDLAKALLCRSGI